jgi:hypothetical protein
MKVATQRTGARVKRCYVTREAHAARTEIHANVTQEGRGVRAVEALRASRLPLCAR